MSNRSLLLVDQDPNFRNEHPLHPQSRNVQFALPLIDLRHKTFPPGFCMRINFGDIQSVLAHSFLRPCLASSHSHMDCIVRHTGGTFYKVSMAAQYFLGSGSLTSLVPYTSSSNQPFTRSRCRCSSATIAVMKIRVCAFPLVKNGPDVAIRSTIHSKRSAIF
jgi:hypothetical protein